MKCVYLYVCGDGGGVSAGLIEATCHLQPIRDGWRTARGVFNL